MKRLDWATVPMFIAAFAIVGLLAFRGWDPEKVFMAAMAILSAASPSLLFKPMGKS
jgi:hypothetical protein